METMIKISEIEGRKAVSARELYQKLEFARQHYGRWEKINIQNNKFAIENIDWVRIPLKGNENEVLDYALSLDFAKRVCMLARTEVGERIRNYFIEAEQNSLSAHAYELLHKHFEIKKRLEAHKLNRREVNRLVYKETIELQENEKKMDDLLHYNLRQAEPFKIASGQTKLFD